MTLTIMSNFGAWLAKTRAERSVSIAEIARRTGLTQVSLNAYERGERNAKRANVMKIAQALADASGAIIMRDRLVQEAMRAAGFIPPGEDGLPRIIENAEGNKWVLTAFGGQDEDFVLTADAARVLAALRVLSPARDEDDASRN